MSRFTGKFDFHDYCEMSLNTTKEEFINNAKIFLGNAQVKVSDPHDLIPYYTNIVCSASPKSVILSEESYIDTLEREFISVSLDSLIKEYKKAKRLKKSFDASNIYVYPSFQEHIPQCIKIIEENPAIIRTFLPNNQAYLNFLINEYFKDISLKRFNDSRIEFLRYASKYGYMSSLDDVKGEMHPLLMKMSVHFL